ncbi:hypothetical protein DX995_27140 [Klebsiella pneumoniae]|nr:hypothetical protein DX995_27140 [Klebsiella pneumoniae]
MGAFPHGSGARQGGPIPTRQRRPARWADSHVAAAPGKMGGFPHGSGARQGGPIPTRQQRLARWADSHAAAAPGGYLHSLDSPFAFYLTACLHFSWSSPTENRDSFLPS